MILMFICISRPDDRKIKPTSITSRACMSTAVEMLVYLLCSIVDQTASPRLLHPSGPFQAKIQSAPPIAVLKAIAQNVIS
jgi:hypothetical protein